MSKLNVKKFKESLFFNDLILRVEKASNPETSSDEKMKALLYILGVEDTINTLFADKDYHYVNDESFVGIQNQLDKSDFLYLRWK